jgi:hypothetical protein
MHYHDLFITYLILKFLYPKGLFNILKLSAKSGGKLIKKNSTVFHIANFFNYSISLHCISLFLFQEFEEETFFQQNLNNTKEIKKYDLKE